jgi:hypothetical protein
MSFSRIRSALYAAAKTLGDVQSVSQSAKRGSATPILMRLLRRVLGRFLSRFLMFK